MNNTTSVLQSSIKSITASMISMRNEVTDLHKQYFDTDASSLVGALSFGQAATVSSKILAQDYLAGITLCEQLKNFYGNGSVTTADYLGTAHILLNGSLAAVSVISTSVEDIGARMKLLAANVVELFKQSKDVLSLYTASEIDVAAATLSNDRVIFGADMTKADLVLGITVIEQFKKMINNEAVTTGDYSSSLMKWSRY